MDDRWANIDLVFRNGLKDFETLPPEDVWDNIKPVITRKRSFIFIKVAAAVTLLISVGTAAFFIGRGTAYSENQLMAGLTPSVAFSIEHSLPVTSNAIVSQIRETPVQLQSPASQFTSTVSYEPTVIDGGEDRIFIADNNAPVSDNGLSYIQETPPDLPGDLDKIITKDKTGMNLSLPGFEPEKAKPAERWSISALASPTYYSKIGSGNDETVREMIASEQSLSSYSGGFSVSYKLSRRVSIQTGFYFASHGQQVDNVYSYSGFQEISSSKGRSNFMVKTSDGPVYSSNPDVFISGSASRIQTMYTSSVFDPEKASLVPIDNSIIQKFGYIQMPLTVKYKFFDRNLALDLAGGISYDFLVGNSAFIKHGDQKYDIGQTEGLNTFVFSSSLGMGMEYNISKKMSFNLEPTFRYFLNPFNDDAGTWIHPYSFGVFSGFSYRF